MRVRLHMSKKSSNFARKTGRKTEHKEELQEMWNTQKIVKLPPLKD